MNHAEYKDRVCQKAIDGIRDAMYVACPYASRSHAGAWQAGAHARLKGKSMSACPYDRNSLGGRRGNIPTGARGYARAWDKGWRFADEQLKRL